MTPSPHRHNRSRTSKGLHASHASKGLHAKRALTKQANGQATDGSQDSFASTDAWSIPRFLAIYSAIFALICLAAFSIHIAQGRSFVWEGDGIKQHLRALIFMGDGFAKSSAACFQVAAFAFPPIPLPWVTAKTW